MAPWSFSLSQRQLSWQALLFYSHCLCILLKSFLCSHWLPFHCHFCPKCPVYSLSISLQLSLEETLAAGDFPATFTCWGLLLIWHSTPQLTQQGLNRTSILQKIHSPFPMKPVKGTRKWQICCGKIWWSSIPLFCFQELNNVSLFITTSLSEKNIKITNWSKASSENGDRQKVLWVPRQRQDHIGQSWQLSWALAPSRISTTWLGRCWQHCGRPIHCFPCLRHRATVMEALKA